MVSHLPEDIRAHLIGFLWGLIEFEHNSTGVFAQKLAIITTSQNTQVVPRRGKSIETARLLLGARGLVGSGRENGSNCLLGVGFFLCRGKNILEPDRWLCNIVTMPVAVQNKLCASKWLILCYVNSASI